MVLGTGHSFSYATEKYLGFKSDSSPDRKLPVTHGFSGFLWFTQLSTIGKTHFSLLKAEKVMINLSLYPNYRLIKRLAVMTFHRMDCEQDSKAKKHNSCLLLV